MKTPFPRPKLCIWRREVERERGEERPREIKRQTHTDKSETQKEGGRAVCGRGTDHPDFSGGGDAPVLLEHPAVVGEQQLEAETQR